MPRLSPVSRSELLRYLRKLGFAGPRSGAKHQFMSKGALKVREPNPHVGDVSIELLRRILRQPGVSKAEWEQL